MHRFAAGRLLQDLHADKRVGDERCEELRERRDEANGRGPVIPRRLVVLAQEQHAEGRQEPQKTGDQRVHDRGVDCQRHRYGQSPVECAQSPLPVEPCCCSQESWAVYCKLVPCGDDLKWHCADPVQLLGDQIQQKAKSGWRLGGVVSPGEVPKEQPVEDPVVGAVDTLCKERSTDARIQACQAPGAQDVREGLEDAAGLAGCCCLEDELNLPHGEDQQLCNDGSHHTAQGMREHGWPLGPPLHVHHKVLTVHIWGPAGGLAGRSPAPGGGRHAMQGCTKGCLS
mmetsp:Transcript_31586/g.94045  ORF Transcript_31586/g.94045 Transcript_31586/m.94045 type:complete len:284 (+) Transcript_31586:583-1434(+)